MKPSTFFSFLLLLLTAACPFANGQDTPSLKAGVDQSSVLIGEPVRLGVDVVFPAGTPVVLPVIDSVPHFEFLAKPRIDSLTEGINIHYRMEWKMASFDSGLFKIPALSVKIVNKEYHSDSIPIAVGYGNADSAKEYHDIKGIIDQANPAVKYIPFAIGTLTILALVAVFFFAAREGRGAAPVLEKKGSSRIIRSPYEEAMAGLDDLRKMPLPDAGAVKKYYSGMNDILRVYLQRTQGLAGMEKTNEEVILHLSRVDLDRTAFTRFASLLRLIDFVKFAKYLPEAPEQVRSLDSMRDMIRIINEIRK